MAILEDYPEIVVFEVCAVVFDDMLVVAEFEDLYLFFYGS